MYLCYYRLLTCISVDWRLLNDEVIDVDADYSARIAVAEFLGLSVPDDTGSGGDGTLADNETICIGETMSSCSLPKTPGPKLPRSMRAVRGALVRATGEEGDYSGECCETKNMCTFLTNTIAISLEKIWNGFPILYSFRSFANTASLFE